LIRHNGLGQDALAFNFERVVKQSILFVMVFAGLGLAAGRASVLLSDSFSYPDGPLVVVSSGLWAHHSGSITGEVNVTSGTVFLSHTNSEDLSVSLGQIYAPAGNAVLYAGFKVNFSDLPSAAGDYFAHFKSPTGTGFNGKVFATTSGASAGSYRIGIANGGNSPSGVFGRDLELNHNYTVVIRYSAGSTATVLWVDPASETDASVAAGDIASGTNSIGAFALRESSGMGSLILDDLVIGTSFADVLPDPNPGPGTLSVLTYNVSGNGATDWSTNAAQVRAIGRQLAFLQPDIITFNEIPNNYVWQMTNFVTAFLPGFYLATNSIGDGYIRNLIASRYPILSSASHLHGTSLAAFGYHGAGFTRDLFEAQVAVPGFPGPLHVFVAHLKATTTSKPQDDANRRAAEAAAVSNYLATVFLPGPDGLQPYVLGGDMNEDIFRPDTERYVSGHPIQALANPATGLQLTTPVNPLTLSDLTESIRRSLDVRFDYVLPCGVLFSNIVTSQVFRTDLTENPPPPLESSDDKTASDHLPVLVVFSNPFAAASRFTSLFVNNQALTLQWNSVPGQSYTLEACGGLQGWVSLADNLVATSGTFTISVPLTNSFRFFRVRHHR